MQTTESKPRKSRVRKHEKVIADVTYMTSSKAAEVLGISKNCVLFYAKNGLKHLELGGCKYFLKEWIDAFIEERIQ